MKTISAALAVATILTPAALHAATVQSTRPGVIDRATPMPKAEVPKAYQPDQKAKAPLKEAPKMEKDAGNQVVARLKSVTFSGNTVISTEELQHVASGYLNRSLTRADIAKLKYQLARLFYDRGYILVKVVTPPQDLSKGVLKVDIYEAKIGEVKVENQMAIDSHIAKGMTDRLSSGDIFRESNIESAVSDIDSLPGVSATVNLAPGKTFGTTDLNFLVNEINEDENEFSIDNYGNSLTGTGEANLHLEHANMLNLGEKFFVDLRKSDDELWSADGGVDTPTGIYNTHLQLQYLASENDIGDRLANLLASGSTRMFSAALSSDLLHTRKHKVTLQTGLEVREHESELANITTTRDDITEGFIRGSYLARTGSAVYFLSTRVSTGLDAFGADDMGHPLASNPLGDPDAWRVEPLFYMNRLSPFSDGSFILTGSGQMASNQLFSSDLFVLGGYGSVRGFDPATLTGESGYQYSLEYDHNLPEWIDGWAFKFGPFLDGGHVYNRVNSGLNTYDALYSAGLGFEAEADLIKHAGPTTFRFDWAHPLSSYTAQNVSVPGAPTLPDDTISSNTFYFRVSQGF